MITYIVATLIQTIIVVVLYLRIQGHLHNIYAKLACINEPKELIYKVQILKDFERLKKFDIVNLLRIFEDFSIVQDSDGNTYEIENIGYKYI